jgi:hypothetical protein
MESNQRTRPVKAGQAWSNLKVFPRNNPMQHTTRISPAGNRFCTISSPIFAPSRKTHVDYQPLTKKTAPRHFVPPQTLLILILICGPFILISVYYRLLAVSLSVPQKLPAEDLNPTNLLPEVCRFGIAHCARAPVEID